MRRESVIGETLSHYHITAKLGAGGMGEVYRAEDTKLGREVAIKALPAEMAEAPERVSRFRREAQLLASLNHPHIAAIHGVEESAGRLFLVLELVEGDDLSERLKRGPVPVEEALAIARQVAEALEEAHEKGVIHRDLKPANIKVTADGNVKVLDFGLAKAFAADASEPNHSHSPTFSMAATREGVLLGTAAYMSPEQAKGLAVDKRTDIFSFGCVLYEMLTGRQAFQSEMVSEILASVLAREPDLALVPPNLHPRLKELLGRCLEKNPKKRWQDVGDLRVEIEAVLADPKGLLVEEAVGARARLSPRAHTLWALTSVAAIVLTAFVARSLAPTPERPVKRFVFDAGAPLGGANPGSMVALSAHGSQLAYLAMEEGRQHLYLRPMDAYEGALIPETAGAYAPFFSPDGQWLAFFSGATVKKVQLPDGRPLNIVGVGATQAGGTWGPDDTLVLVNAPQLLPDGDSVLFSVTTGFGPGGSGRWDNAQIVAQSLSSGERTVLLEGGSDARYVSSGHLVYALDDGLFAVPFDAASLRAVSGPVSMVEGVVRAGFAASANYAVSEDGTLFFLAGAASTHPLSWVDRTGRVEVIETIPPNDFERPRLSPDGERVLVLAEGDARIYDLASGRETRLTTDGATDYVGWTPSGAEVTYTSARGSQGGDVWIQPADGSGPPRQLTALDGSVHFDAWAPDGRTFAAHHHIGGTTNQLMVAFDGEDAEPETWLEHEHSDSSAVFSPDARYVAHVSSQTGQTEIYIRPFPGPGGQTTVSVGGGREPVWAPTGELFYRRTRDYMMMVVEVSTDPVLTVGPPVELFAGRGPRGGSPTARYTVTADGQRFLMSANLLPSGEAGAGSGQGPQVIVVQNWVEELKERVPN